MPAKNQKAYHTQYRSSVDEDATAKRALEVKPSGRRHASMCKTYIFSFQTQHFRARNCKTFAAYVHKQTFSV